MLDEGQRVTRVTCAPVDVRIQTALCSRATGEEQRIDVAHATARVDNNGADQRHDHEVEIWRILIGGEVRARQSRDTHSAGI